MQFTTVRPDLEEKYDRRVEEHKMNEAARTERAYRRVGFRKKEQQAVFNNQREHNFKLRCKSASRDRPNNRSTEDAHLEDKHEGEDDEGNDGESRFLTKCQRGVLQTLEKKDWIFYRGNGNLWSDFRRVPEDRIHLVVNHKMIAADEKARDLILKKRQEEQHAEKETWMRKVERAEGIRQEFIQRKDETKKTELNVLKNRSPPKIRPLTAFPTRRGHEGEDGLLHHNQDPHHRSHSARPSSKKERVYSELAKPIEKPFNRSINVDAISDCKGLLVNDHHLTTHIKSALDKTYHGKTKMRPVSAPATRSQKKEVKDKPVAYGVNEEAVTEGEDLLETITDEELLLLSLEENRTATLEAETEPPLALTVDTVTSSIQPHRVGGHRSYDPPLDIVSTLLPLPPHAYIKASKEDTKSHIDGSMQDLSVGVTLLEL
jgi:hypothetical protein